MNLRITLPFGLLFSVLTCVLYGQNVPTVFRYPTGVVSSEGTMRDGKPDGYWKSYFPTGKIQSEGNRKNFMLDGIWTFYNERGDTLKKVSYLYGLKNGYYCIFQTATAKDSSLKNVVISRELYSQDIKQGKSYLYDKKGRLQNESYYKNGKRDGEGREYDSIGRVITLLEYLRDQIIRIEPINRSDSKGWKQGTWREFYPNSDRVHIEANYIDDKLTGYYKEYSPTGKLLDSKRYMNGNLFVDTVQTLAKKAIVQEEFYPNGNLKSTGNFIGTRKIGIHKQLDTLGNVIASETFDTLGFKKESGIFDKSNRKQGKWKQFYETGELKAEGNFVDNKQDGDWTFYFRNGKVEQKGKYKGNKQDGEWKWYFPNGNLLRTEQYEKGTLEGLLIEYSQNGDTIAIGMYISGLREGKWYFRSGTISEIGNYLNDMRNGIWKYYYLNSGKLRFQGEFRQDQPNGKHLYYDEKGILQIESFYREGKRDKTWSIFDEEGNVSISITYENDEEVKIDGIKIK